MLGQPVDLEVGPQAAQFVGDGDVTLSMTKPDGRRDVQCSLATVPGPPPGQSGCRRWLDEVVQQQVDLHRIAALGAVPTALDGHQPPARHLSQPGTSRVWVDGILIAMNDEHRAMYTLGELLDGLFIHRKRRILGRDQHLWGCLKPPAYSVLDLLG